jgi:hypothetical protein
MVDLDRPRFQRDALAVARQIIGPLALDLDGGVLRGDLLDQADEPRQQVQDRIWAGLMSLAWVTRPSVSSVSRSSPQATVKR